jgi:hypothetical protein
MSTITKLDPSHRTRRTERRTLVALFSAKPGIKHLEVWLKLRTIQRRSYRTGNQKQSAFQAVIDDVSRPRKIPDRNLAL